MIIRTAPWMTQKSISFLNNFFKWYPSYLQRELYLLEFGCGNSTIYFLQKGCRVLTVEDDETFISDLITISKSMNISSIIVNDFSNINNLFLEYKLIILKASSYSEVTNNIFKNFNFDIVVNDGISRKEVLVDFEQYAINSILILDNCEYCANWGRLARSSAKVETVKIYRKFLRNTNWTKYIFEQPEGREGHCSMDAFGWESPNRWATAICWSNSHILNKFMITSIGNPLVNSEGIDDEDINTLNERCPYDFQNNKWLKDEYPDSLNLGLKRDFF